MHKAFHLLDVNDYVTKLCRQQAEDILNDDNENARYIGQGEGRYLGSLNLAAVRHETVQVSRQLL
jgi:hypothetical protein